MQNGVVLIAAVPFAYTEDFAWIAGKGKIRHNY
jgi:hypothetical protein